MHRFFCGHVQTFEANEIVTLDDEQSHHARRVLRLKPGAAVEIFNGRGDVTAGVLEAPQPPADEADAGGDTSAPRRPARRVVAVRIVEVTHHPRLHPSIDIAAAVPKGGRAEAMVDQLSQVGADRWIPLLSTHSVVNPRTGKLGKFTRAAVEAAKQCGRAHLMDVAEPTPLAALLDPAIGYDVRLIAAPPAAGGTDSVARETVGKTDRILVLIGPEGGWHDSEMRDALAAGFTPWSLGPHVMRIETAATVAAALIRFASG